MQEKHEGKQHGESEEAEAEMMRVLEEQKERERVAQKRVEDFRQQREQAEAEKRGREEEARAAAMHAEAAKRAREEEIRGVARAKLKQVERVKEYKILKKKLDKLDAMVDDLIAEGGEEARDGKECKKWEKKREEYISSLETYDEWAAELETRRQAKEEERRKKEQEEEGKRLRLEEERRMVEENARHEAEAEAQRQREIVEAKEREAREAVEAKEREEREAAEAKEREERAVAETQERAEREAAEAKAREEAEARQREERERAEKEEAERKEREAAEAAEKAANSPEEPAQQTQVTSEETPKENKPEKRKSQASEEFLDRRNLPLPHSDNTKQILRELEAVDTLQEKLVKTLNQNGIAASEDIEYEVAKDKMTEIQGQMQELNASQEDQFVMQKKMYKLEEEMSKYVTALMLTDEYAEEQQMLEKQWDDSVKEGNAEALRKLRRHLHVNIKNMTEEELTTQPTPNGKMLPKAFAKKFKRTNVLQLIRSNPDDLERIHPSLLEAVRTTGLTLTERRAVYEHLKDVGSTWEAMQQDKSIERKWVWFSSIKSKLKESLTAYNKNVEQYGPPGNHPYAKRNDPKGGGCPLLGNQCPVKADSVICYDDDFGYTPEAEYEASEAKKSNLSDDSGHSSVSASSRPAKKAARSNGSKSSKEKDAEILAALREELVLQEPESDIDKKLLRELFFAKKRGMNLEKQLIQNGIAIPKDDISYSVAKVKVAELTEEIKAVASKMGAVTDPKELYRLEAEYGKLSEEMEKYTNAIRLTKEWAQEQVEKERQWEESVRPDNQVALKKLRRHMPVYIRDMSEEELTQVPTPNGKSLPQKIARKFKRTNILLLLRTDPKSIEPMHPSSIEGMRTTGLTLTERRALHEHLKELGPKWKTMASDKMAERKWMWHESLKNKYKELVEKYQPHIDQYGPPDNHPYAKRNDPNGGGCPLLGNQCPVKADLAIDYNNDYGFSEEAEYNIDKAVKSNLLSVEDLEKRKNEEEGVNIYEEENPYQAAPPPRPSLPPPPPASSAPRPKPPGGLMAALASREDAPPKRPANPMAGGLMAALASRGKK